MPLVIYGLGDVHTHVHTHTHTHHTHTTHTHESDLKKPGVCQPSTCLVQKYRATKIWSHTVSGLMTNSNRHSGQMVEHEDRSIIFINLNTYVALLAHLQS